MVLRKAFHLILKPFGEREQDSLEEMKREEYITMTMERER